MKPETANMLHLMQSDMMQTVVHDLRTPMTVIKGYLQLLLSGGMGEMQSEQRAVLQRSVAPLEDLILLTENLLQSVSLQKEHVQLNIVPIDLDHLLAETIEFYQLPFQQRHMRIFRDGNTLGAKILADAFWIKRVLHNLVWNAYKFTPDYGHVSLQVSRLDDGGLQLQVKDTGRGISAEHLGRIFEKFTQAAPEKDCQSGSGIGLWICQRIMQLHGGRVTVESVEGQGTCFSLQFPSRRVL